jgi:hypothetical protein
MTVRDGVLVSRNASDSAVQVSVQETSSAELNSHWDTADLLKVKDITLSDGTSKGSFLSAHVTGVVRFSDSHNVSVVLFETALGRFILQDSDILPAEDFKGGIHANVTSADIIKGHLSTYSGRETPPTGHPFQTLQATDLVSNAGRAGFVILHFKFAGKIKLCMLQKLTSFGCFLIREDGRNTLLGEICASTAMRIFQMLPCSPTRAAMTFVRSVFLNW